MDKIRKAMDLARQERLQIAREPLERRTWQRSDAAEVDRLDVDAPAEAFGRVESTAPLDMRPSTTGPAVIRYTRTRVFKPEPSVVASSRIISPLGTDAAAGAFRMLRTQVLQRMSQNQWRTLGVFSPSSNEGKTLTAINLAISLAADQRYTVLLVDFDLRRPSLMNSFGLQPEVGVDDLLRGHASVEDCLVHPDGFDRLVLLPARSALPDSSELLAGGQTRALVEALRGRYADRIIIFDLPPVLSADDALAFAPMIECGLVVAAEGSTRREDLLRCMELLQRLPLVGTVLNRASATASAYG